MTTSFSLFCKNDYSKRTVKPAIWLYALYYFRTIFVILDTNFAREIPTSQQAGSTFPQQTLEMRTTVDILRHSIRQYRTYQTAANVSPHQQ